MGERSKHWSDGEHPAIPRRTLARLVFTGMGMADGVGETVAHRFADFGSGIGIDGLCFHTPDLAYRRGDQVAQAFNALKQQGTISQ